MRSLLRMPLPSRRLHWSRPKFIPSVTFLFRAPNAQEVKLTREGAADPLPMHKDDAACGL